ncbi:hypothetical protein O0I10_010726 [Lichtheimia ornata]|uniref:P-loop containing nucleoside triphosphate hydrolase protein n=1 Tax=Lichtheimia ornata TaxID=688661 RepID=A0AAD7UVH8_9FUNG|nr:uncharacterized protein O0I10_010726 [Lichtheimia ornata]KAJ8653579.1 hypothetical protein O0I10_010726 [Lichtheimia ornata]
MPLQIIGAGYSRTGTLSLCQALETLGFKTHHGMSVITDPKQDPSIWWSSLQQQQQQQYMNKTIVDWEKAYKNYDAAVDWPTCVFYKELMQHYPESRVILVVRSPESWYKSVQRTILPLVRLSRKFKDRMLPEHVKQVRALWLQSFIYKDEQQKVPMDVNEVYNFLFDPAAMRQMYMDHIEDVKRSVPAERLLVMTLGRDGWDPLCQFLGVPIPKDLPYPCSNSSDDFSDLFWSAMRHKKRTKKAATAYSIESRNNSSRLLK